MTVKQLAEGHGFKYLHLSQPSWVQSIWQAGFFPLRPPFVYSSPGGYMYVFPPAFQVINSFFYSILGYKGLYTLPLLCTLLLWLVTILLLKRCNIAPSRIAMALFLLIFCSPLTLYGTIYWEHLPATLLLFSGLAFIVSTPDRVWAAIAMGLVSGLAIFLRPEAIMMNFLYALAVFVLYRRDKRSIGEKRPVYIAFVSCLFLSVLAFMAFNKLEYGSFLGPHGYQLTDATDTDDHLGFAKGLSNLGITNYKSIRSFAFILLLFPIVYRLTKTKDSADLRPGLLASIVLVFCLLTPFILPNAGGKQWGARYFLPVIPIVVVLLFLIDQQWKILEGGAKIPMWLRGFILLCTAYSFYYNTFTGGVEDLRWSYISRVTPYLDELEKKDGNVVVVSDAYMVYEMGYLFDKDYFFLAPGDDSLNRLLPLLKRQGIHEYTYIFNPRNPASQPKSLRDSTTKYLWPLAGTKKIKDEFYCTKYVLP